MILGKSLKPYFPRVSNGHEKNLTETLFHHKYMLFTLYEKLSLKTIKCKFPVTYKINIEFKLEYYDGFHLKCFKK